VRDRQFLDCQPVTLGRHQSVVKRLFGQQDQKFFAPVAIDLVAAPSRVRECPRHGPEHFIAGEMALAVVICLEKIDVAHDGATGVAIAIRPRVDVVEILAQSEATAELGQRVGTRLIEELTIEPLQFR